MKRVLATAWMALALGVAGWAQDRAPLTFNGGYTLGFSAAQVRGDGIEGFVQRHRHLSKADECR